MATLKELKVVIGDTVSFPIWNESEKGKPGYDPRQRHTATIVGPISFPKSGEVLLAPPVKDYNLYLYDPNTGDKRATKGVKNWDMWGRPTSEGPATLRTGEIVVQSIHTAYPLFERAS